VLGSWCTVAVSNAVESVVWQGKVGWNAHVLAMWKRFDCTKTCGVGLQLSHNKENCSAQAFALGNVFLGAIVDRRIKSRVVVCVSYIIPNEN